MELPPVTQQYVDMITQGHAPWMEGKKVSQWSDSTKQQFFEIFNTELANEMELERWRLNNEYNTPRAQMQRMIEAGINPSAAYSSVSSGNAASAPDSHVAGAAPFHDTSDKLQRINTIMNGITSIMSTINQGVDAVAGIQGISYAAQNNWFDRMRADWWNSSIHPSGSAWLFDAKEAEHRDRPIEVAPGLFMEGTIAQAFPELVPQSGFAGGKYHQGQSSVDIQQQLAKRRTRIDQLIQNIVQGLDGHASTDQMMNYFLQLFMYGAMSKFGGF